jgi:apolipoprotein N-acyltransferase
MQSTGRREKAAFLLALVAAPVAAVVRRRILIDALISLRRLVMAGEGNLVDRPEDGSGIVELRSAWATVGLSVLSGVLMALSMPNFNLWPLAWIALVPLLTAFFLRPPGPTFLYVLPCTLLWWLAAHVWYPDVLGPVLGLFLVGVGGLFYAALIELGLLLWRKGPDYLKLLALPVTWTSLEWLRSVAPVTRDWWFILLAQSQWNFPPALQVLSITGWPGLSFTIMLANAGLALLLVHLIRRRSLSGSAAIAAAASALVVLLGAASLPNPPEETIPVVATTDWLSPPNGRWASREERSKVAFEVNAGLTHQAMRGAGHPAFVIWPENFSNRLTQQSHIERLKALAAELDVHLVAHMLWPVEEGAEKVHNGVMLFGPEGKEVGRQRKIHQAPWEWTIPGPAEYPVFPTTHGTVGLGVCLDYHYTDVVRNLARKGARLVFMPTNDDYNDSRWFPGAHASDAPLRAVENRVAIATSTTSGISTICDPYGRVIAQGEVNTRGVIVGDVFTVDRPTLYTRFGHWFGVLTMIALGGNIILRLGVSSRRDGTALSELGAEPGAAPNGGPTTPVRNSEVTGGRHR